MPAGQQACVRRLRIVGSGKARIPCLSVAVTASIPLLPAIGFACARRTGSCLAGLRREGIDAA
jgi:hypothetical protein